MVITDRWSRLITLACIGVAIYLPASATAALYQDATLQTTDGVAIGNCGNAFRKDVPAVSICGWTQSYRRTGAAVAWVVAVAILLADLWRRTRRRRRRNEIAGAPSSPSPNGP